MLIPRGQLLIKCSRVSAVCLAAALGLVACLSAAPALALTEGGTGRERIRPSHFAEDTCRVIDEEASRHRLPAHFFARLVWRESLFDPSAVSHKGAQGIAQFMPATAAERGLANAFDPATALTASAGLLADLTRQFGSLGLAAAAYNAGPGAVERWRAGNSGLPDETQAYVHWITGHSAEEWVNKVGLKPLSISGKLSFMAACKKLATRSLSAQSPDRELKTASVSKPAEAKLGLKRVKAVERGRVAVVLNIKSRSPAKSLARRKRH